MAYHQIRQRIAQGIGRPVQRLPRSGADANRDWGFNDLGFGLESLWTYQRPGNPAPLPVGTVFPDLIGGVNMTLAGNVLPFVGTPYHGWGAPRFGVLLNFLNGTVGDYNIGMGDFCNPLLLRFRERPTSNREVFGKVGALTIYRILYSTVGRLVWQLRDSAGVIFTATVISDHSNLITGVVPFINTSVSALSGVRSARGYAQVSIVGAASFSDGTGIYRHANVTGSTTPADYLAAGATTSGAPSGRAQADQVSYGLWRGGFRA